MGSDGSSPADTEHRTELLGDDPARRQPRVLVFWDGGTQSAPLAPGATVVVGRSRDCDLVVDHASISRRHVAVHAGPPTVVEDLGSSNGTVVDGVRLEPRARTTVGARSVVEVGACMMLVQETADAARSSTSATPATAAPMAKANQLLDLVAKSDISVLLTGETGVGKEVAAERIHAGSARAGERLVKINCAAFPDALLESELFGYERGAFSGATAAKAGLIETANGGTLFLDEIGETSPAIQSKLLRVLESRELQRLGATAARKVDVRFVSATNRDLQALSASGAFRSDLFYRINGITIDISPLRQRRDEILPLAARFLRDATRGGTAPRLGDAAAAVLMAHAWPGNIRELKNVIERAAVLATGGVIEPVHLQLEPAASSTAAPRTLRGEIDEAGRRAVLDALERAGGNQTKAARLLGISRRALLYRLEEMDVPRPRKGRG